MCSVSLSWQCLEKVCTKNVATSPHLGKEFVWIDGRCCFCLQIGAVSSSSSPAYSESGGLDSQLISASSGVDTATGLRMYQCPQCYYSTPKKSHLIEHLRTHTGEKPFACPLCHYRASCKSNLNKHVRNRHGIESNDVLLLSFPPPTD